MKKNNGSTLKNISTVSSTTVLSRILGFWRDMTFFSFFGTSAMGAAFLLAFSLPNLFRRLLGEGALSSAIMPVMSSHYVKHGKDSMLRLFSHIILRLLVIFAVVLICAYGLIALAYGIIALISSLLDGPKWNMALKFTALLLPYMVFVCLAAIVAVVLNLMGRFLVSSVNQIWMNLSMILSLLIGGYGFGLCGMQLVHCLIAGVLLGGLIQLAIPLLAVFMCGWRPQLDPNVPMLKEDMADVWKLFLPGMFGAAVEQLNFLISRTIAYTFSPPAVSLMYLSNRLTELPMGIFGWAIITVFFPSIAKVVNSKSDTAVINRTFNETLVAMVWILLPSALGIFLLKKEILSVFFVHGKFTANDIHQILPIMSVYCISLVFSGISSLLIRGFHSLKDTKTPARIGIVVVMANVTFSLIFMKIFNPIGLDIGIRLALANALATIVQTICLSTLLKRKMKGWSIWSEFRNYATIFYGCIWIAAVATSAKIAVGAYCHFGQRTNDTITIIVGVTLSALAYLIANRKLIAKVWASRKV
ncbi:MAG: murein biosynthesis integral membrane protein MurJ [Puniceicoccales bacterium]|jgi:putative peptidoglycan lipid II flippase|nr:murein biosynthesis integral membrane protein MurJ [Puniceicoccales bacterium]